MPGLPESQLGGTLWQTRSLDMFLIGVLIFAGALAMLGLLADGKKETVEP